MTRKRAANRRTPFFAFAHDAIADLLGCSRVDVALI